MRLGIVSRARNAVRWLSLPHMSRPSGLNPATHKKKHDANMMEVSHMANFSTSCVRVSLVFYAPPPYHTREEGTYPIHVEYRRSCGADIWEAWKKVTLSSTREYRGTREGHNALLF